MTADKTPRAECTGCGYMTRNVDTALCVDCTDRASGGTPADPYGNMDPAPLHPEYVVGMLLSSLEVGLEGCPAFDHLNGTSEGMLTAESWNSRIDGKYSSTRYVTIEGKRYSVRVQQD